MCLKMEATRLLGRNSAVPGMIASPDPRRVSPLASPTAVSPTAVVARSSALPERSCLACDPPRKVVQF